jgi:hypothetical protein
MLGESAIERGAGFGIDRLSEVETRNLGAGVIRQRRDGEGRHGRSSHAVFVRKTLTLGAWRVKAPHGRAAGSASVKGAAFYHVLAVSGGDQKLGRILWRYGVD